MRGKSFSDEDSNEAFDQSIRVDILNYITLFHITWDSTAEEDIHVEKICFISCFEVFLFCIFVVA